MKRGRAERLIMIHQGTPVKNRLKQIDWIGLVLSVGGFVCWIMAISFGGTLCVYQESVLRVSILTSNDLQLYLEQRLYHRPVCRWWRRLGRLLPTTSVRDWHLRRESSIPSAHDLQQRSRAPLLGDRQRCCCMFHPCQLHPDLLYLHTRRHCDPSGSPIAPVYLHPQLDDIGQRDLHGKIRILQALVPFRIAIALGWWSFDV